MLLVRAAVIPCYADVNPTNTTKAVKTDTTSD